jgi:hypothetical protein
MKHGESTAHAFHLFTMIHSYINKIFLKKLLLQNSDCICTCRWYRGMSAWLQPLNISAKWKYRNHLKFWWIYKFRTWKWFLVRHVMDVLLPNAWTVGWNLLINIPLPKLKALQMCPKTQNCDFLKRPNDSRPSVQPPPKRLTERHFLERIPPTGKWQDLTEDVWCAQKRARGKNLSIGVVNVRQHCIYKDASRCIIHSSTSKPPASIDDIQGAHIIR